MRAALALAAVAVLAGCGGGGTPAQAPPRVDRVAQLERYLDRMEGHERRFNRLLDSVASSVGGVEAAKPGPAWTRAAKRLSTVSAGLNDLGSAVGAMRPPQALEPAHRRLAEATLAFGEYVFNLEQALRVRIPASLETAADADTSAIKQARLSWVKAVEGYAARLGTVLPEWMAPSPAG